eukprot:1297273-Rhodomonas_salina.2
MAGVDDSQRSGSAMTPGPMDTSADEGIRTAQFAERYLPSRAVRDALLLRPSASHDSCITPLAYSSTVRGVRDAWH